MFQVAQLCQNSSWPNSSTNARSEPATPVPQWRAKRAEAEAAIRLLPHHVERRQRSSAAGAARTRARRLLRRGLGVARTVGQQVGQAQPRGDDDGLRRLMPGGEAEQRGGGIGRVHHCYSACKSAARAASPQRALSAATKRVQAAASSGRSGYGAEPSGSGHRHRCG